MQLTMKTPISKVRTIGENVSSVREVKTGTLRHLFASEARAPVSLSKPPEPKTICRRLISTRSRDRQIDFRTGSRSAPDLQCAGHLSSAFEHGLQPVVPGAAFFH